jgi:NAD(P)-dependent dehydrogenase (short-subunit alcohol dehydrogenase family)
MRVVAVTGSASGIGAAVRSRLEGEGARVVGVDVRNAEIVADLAGPFGRTRALEAIRRECGGQLDGVVACAGVGPHVMPRSTIVSVDYFGAQAMLAGLGSCLAAARGSAVAVASNSAIMPNADGPLVDACLAGEEAEARRVAETLDGPRVYAGSKLALVRWLRRHAPRAEWAGAGVRLNAVAPGPVQTPLLEKGLEDPVLGPAIRGFPVPTGAFGTPAEIAAAVAFLLGPEASFCCGAVLFVDGGTDALLRPDAF